MLNATVISKGLVMNRPTGLEFGYYTTTWLWFTYTCKTIGWEYDDYITTKDVLVKVGSDFKKWLKETK